MARTPAMPRSTERGTTTNVETPSIATTLAIDATVFNSSLFHYHDQASQHRFTGNQKSQPGRELAALLVIGADDESHIR